MAVELCVGLAPGRDVAAHHQHRTHAVRRVQVGYDPTSDAALSLGGVDSEFGFPRLPRNEDAFDDLVPLPAPGLGEAQLTVGAAQHLDRGQGQQQTDVLRHEQVPALPVEPHDDVGQRRDQGALFLFAALQRSLRLGLPRDVLNHAHHARGRTRRVTVAHPAAFQHPQVVAVAVAQPVARLVTLAFVLEMLGQHGVNALCIVGVDVRRPGRQGGCHLVGPVAQDALELRAEKRRPGRDVQVPEAVGGLSRRTTLILALAEFGLEGHAP